MRPDGLSSDKNLFSCIRSDEWFHAHAGSLLDVLNPESTTYKLYKGYVDAFLLDTPWGIIPNCRHDVPISEVDVRQAVKLMISCFPTDKEDGSPDGWIGVRCDVSPTHQARWYEAMKSEGMYVSVIRVMDTQASSNSRSMGNVHKPSVTTNGHTWIIGKMRYRMFRASDVCGKSLRVVFLFLLDIKCHVSMVA